MPPEVVLDVASALVAAWAERDDAVAERDVAVTERDALVAAIERQHARNGCLCDPTGRCVLERWAEGRAPSWCHPGCVTVVAGEPHCVVCSGPAAVEAR